MVQVTIRNKKQLPKLPLPSLLKYLDSIKISEQEIDRIVNIGKLLKKLSFEKKKSRDEV